MEKNKRNNVISFIMSAVLLAVMAFVFLHSECGLLSCYDGDHHETHDFCQLVSNTVVSSPDAGPVHIDLEPVIILSPDFKITSTDNNYTLTCSVSDFKIPPKDILHINRTLLI